MVLNKQSKQFDIPAEIVGPSGHGSWKVEINGEVKIRNQRYLRKSKVMQSGNTEVNKDNEGNSRPYNLRPNRETSYSRYY